MAEYAAMIVVSAMATTLYLGGWYFPFLWRLDHAGYHSLFVLLCLVVFVAKMAVLLYIYFWLRWTFPRYRYDQLMDLGWKWMLPAALLNIALTALAVFTVQALNGWHGLRTLRTLTHGQISLTLTGKLIAFAFGIAGLFIAAAMLSAINWRSRDFNLKKQRRQVRLVSPPQGQPAVAPVQATSES